MYFAYHHFPIQLRTHWGGGDLSEHLLLIFGLISLTPLIPLTNINNFPTLCPLNFYLICVNIQFAIKYNHSPHISSFPLKFVLKYRVSQKPPTGFVNVPLWGSTGDLPKFWSSRWQLLLLPSQPQKCMYSLSEESMCPGWVDHDFHQFPEVLENPVWYSLAYISLDL